MTSLVLLSLTSNYLHAPDMFLTLPKLQQLYLGNNSFSGPLPISVTNASMLHTIDLFSCNFSGSIPNNLGGNLKDLELLNLGWNKLGTEKGDDLSFITSLVTCTKLKILWVPKNQLKGVMPNSVAYLSTTMTCFRLEQNFISGTIPEGIGNLLMNLELRVLSHNFQLEGEIPDSIAKLSNLKLFYIIETKIGGRIPPSIGNLSSLTHLYLSGNRLEGTIPASLGKCTNLIVLSLVGNFLAGEVPEQLFELPSLAMGLLLTSNNLSGPLPSQVGQLENIWYLDLAEKNMQGEIPTTVGDCQLLEYIDLQGSFGVFYKGVLQSSNDRIIAVKVIKLEEEGASKSFMTECEALRNIRHRNLVKTITSCSNTEDFHGNDFKALVFEFMAHGSVEKWLHPSEGGTTPTPRLSLLQRLSIAIDVAAALNYLHHLCHSPIIVHCDLKSSNVLLNSDLTAHLSDFGLANSLVETSSIRILRGAVGYVAPEYGLGGAVSTQGDVYSFGILSSFCKI